MKLTQVDLEKTNKFSKTFLDYISGQDQLKPFYCCEPLIKNFKHHIQQRNFPTEKRLTLHQALINQYQSHTTHDKVKSNIEQLKGDKTYTIVTGHQLNIFTGPLYFIYKIVTVINACKALKKEYPEYNFVPVYWMASEDHDFEEISYFRLNGLKHKWETTQKGAVGRFDPSALLAMCKDIPGIPDLFHKAYAQPTLAEAARYYVNELFGDHGLVVVDGDDKNLKSQFVNVIKEDLFDHTPNELVSKQSDELDKLGYKTQVYPREVNFFYLDGSIRNRLVKTSEGFEVTDSDLKFSEDEINQLIQQSPEKFSPNVILRPLFQEVVLPNLAYVGGPSELVYWLQLNSVFNHFKTPFPILMPRNFGLMIPGHIKRKLDKTSFSIEEIFSNPHNLQKQIAEKFAEHDIHLNGQKESILDVFNKIKNQANQIDPTLTAHVEAQQARISQKLEVIEQKFLRAEKRNQADKVNQLQSVLDYLFPNGGLQERADNFLNFYMADPSFITQLITYFEPFDYRFNVLSDG